MKTKGSGLAKSETPTAVGSSAYRMEAGDLILSLRVQPGAARSEWAGRHGERAFRLRLAAPPVDGRANRACIRFLAEAAGVPASAVTILRGASSRDKTVRIKSITAGRLAALKAQWAT